MTTVLGFTYVVEQLSSSLFLSILTFGFDLILGSIFTFWGRNGLFLGFGKGSNTVLGSTHVVEQLSFSMFSSISIFEFYLQGLVHPPAPGNQIDKNIKNESCSTT